ncbi:protein of unassigned function [Methylobacterium oryzae CBMB20]|uniref:Protein of unassigned function n=1 Tax=Methylobacterium oryzae CBMB20 TaxID=693986 RepID=A0A089NNY8_9HYPH|nr:protein of unassigned function [Methylobacterium oryzae CBMB20]
MTGRSARRAQDVGCQHAGMTGHGRPSDRGEVRHGFSVPGRLLSSVKADRIANQGLKSDVLFRAMRWGPLAASCASCPSADE